MLDSTLATALTAAAPDAPGLDAPCREILAMILNSPLSFALAEPPGRAAREQLATTLAVMKIPPSGVASFLRGLAVRFTLDDLAEAENAGWIQSWPVGDVLAVSLAPLTAEVLGVELREIGSDGDESTWAVTDNARRRPYHLPRLRGHRVSDRETWLDTIEDDAPGPVEAAIIAEEFLMMQAIGSDGQPELDPETGKPCVEPVVLFGRKIPRARTARATKTKARVRNAPRPDPRSNPDRPPAARAKARGARPAANSFDLSRLRLAIGA